MEGHSNCNWAYIHKTNISHSHLTLWGKAHSRMSSPEHVISSGTFYLSQCHCLVIFMQLPWLIFSQAAQALLRYQYFFTAQLWEVTHCGMRPSQVFSTCALHAIGFCMCVCLGAESHDSCLHRERWVLKKQKQSLHHILIQDKVNSRESMCAVSLLRNQLLATEFHRGRQNTGLYRTLAKLPWCFSFPYLHIFYHLLCKEGCKCKHRIHLCWDKMHAHHSLIQQHIHQHLQKRNTEKISLRWYLL